MVASAMQATVYATLIVAAGALTIKQDAASNATFRVQFIHQPHPQHLADFAGWDAAPHTNGMQKVSIASPGGAPVTVMTFPTHEDVHVSGGLNGGRGWELDMVQRVYTTWFTDCQRKGHFLDTGANIGSWTLPIAASMAGTASAVISIEAMPPIADHLRAGIAVNHAGNVALFPYAVGEASSTSQVEMALNPTNKGGSAVVGNKGWTHGAAQKFTVGLTTVDAILQAEPRMANVCYAKFDIEGNEGRMLAGAHAFFTKHPPCVVFFELNNIFLMNAGTSQSQIESQLANLGYDIATKLHVGGASWQFKQKNMAACVSRLS